MNVRNLRHNAAGSIDCEIEHPTLGWVPFTASPDDSDAFGRTLHAEILAGEHGEIAAYVAPVIRYTAEQIERLRLRAYADPLTGSDRHFAEAMRMQAMGEEGWETVRDQGIARFNQIQATYPWPDDLTL